MAITQEEQRERWERRQAIRERADSIMIERKDRCDALMKKIHSELNIRHKAEPKKKTRQHITKASRKANRT